MVFSGRVQKGYSRLLERYRKMRERPQRAVISLALILLTLGLAGCRTEISETGNAGDSPQVGTELPEDTFESRCAVLLEKVAEDYRPTDYTDRGKYSFPKAIARMHIHGLEDPEAAGYLQEYADGEYGFFHFPFVGITRLMALYPAAPSVSENKSYFLNRILLHDPAYHYNALTGEGTENHVSMSRTSGYLFAEMALADGELETVAAEWKALLKEWILDWSKRIYAYGTGEWDSNPYTTYNLVGWLNLYDFARDPEIRDAAQAVLDYYAANMALKYTQGLYSGPESRGGTRYGSLSRSATEYLAWLWFGPLQLSENDGFYAQNEYIQSVYAATSGYRPPEELQHIAAKRLPKPAIYHNLKPNYQLTRKAESREVFRIDDTFTLGTVQTPLGGWINSAYGIVNWKLVIQNEDGLPAVVSGNGGMKSLTSPRGRNPFDQFLQHGAVVVQMSRVPAEAEKIEEEVEGIFLDWKITSQRDFMERWGRPHHFGNTHMSDSGKGSLENAGKSIIHLPDNLDYALFNRWAFTQYAGTFLAFRTLSGNPPELSHRRLVDEAPRNSVSGFIIEVANARDFPSYQAFIELVLSNNFAFDREKNDLEFNYKSLEGNSLQFSYSTSGEWNEMLVDWGSGVLEKRIGFNTTDWQQPDWPSGEGHGRIPNLLVDGSPIDWPDRSTIIDGPFLRLQESMLQIEGPAGSIYQIDFSSR